MTVKQLARILNDLPPEFLECEIEFGSELSCREGVTGWTDRAIHAVYANPDRDDIVLCSGEVGNYLNNGEKRDFLRLIPIFRE